MALGSNYFYVNEKLSAEKLNTAVEEIDNKYEKPSTGIPSSDLEEKYLLTTDISDWAKQPTKPTYTKEEIDLSNVDNTSDLNKPISTATQNALDNKIDKIEGKSLSANDFTTVLKEKLENIDDNANNYVLPVASSTTLGGIKVGTNLSISDGILSSKDTIYTHPTTSGNKHIPSGGSSGQILRWSADGTAVWGNDNNTTYENATSSSNGLMSSSDKSKLDGIAANANNYSLPTASTTALGGVKSQTTGTTANRFYSVEVNSDGTMKVNVPWTDTNTTYSNATSTAAGLMSSTDKNKLDTVASNATSDSALSTSEVTAILV